LSSTRTYALKAFTEVPVIGAEDKRQIDVLLHRFLHEWPHASHTTHLHRQNAEVSPCSHSCFHCCQRPSHSLGESLVQSDNNAGIYRSRDRALWKGASAEAWIDLIDHHIILDLDVCVLCTKALRCVSIFVSIQIFISASSLLTVPASQQAASSRCHPTAPMQTWHSQMLQRVGCRNSSRAIFG
jgi:hypothetical protein